MKAIAKRILPMVIGERRFTSLMARRSRNHQVSYLRSVGFLDLNRRFIERYGTAVLHGPFAGMLYPKDSALSRNAVPMLLGSFESELHPIIEAIPSRHYQRIVDVGCAEGYYVVGLARSTRLPVIGYDVNEAELNACHQMAGINGVRHLVELKGWCDSGELRSTCPTRSFIICDCEGYEHKLFDTDTLRSLTESDILIEMHGDCRLLLDRCRQTHSLTIIQSSKRLTVYPELEFLGNDGPRLLCERTEIDSQEWALLRSLDHLH